MSHDMSLSLPTDIPPQAATTLRYFLTHRGVTLPLVLVLAEELAPEALRNRNTYFPAGYSAAGQLLWIEKRVYGDVELRHDDTWNAAGHLVQATITAQHPDQSLPGRRPCAAGIQAIGSR
jgi:hypothetical protein